MSIIAVTPCSKAFERQGRAVMDEIDLMILRPQCREVRKHQFGAAHTFPDAVFEIEPDSHDRVYGRATRTWLNRCDTSASKNLNEIS
jgi:hypothetical protein